MVRDQQSDIAGLLEDLWSDVDNGRVRIKMWILEDWPEFALATGEKRGRGSTEPLKRCMH